MSSTSDDVEVLKTPIRSLSDRKEYKLIKLQNGLKVLIVKQNKESDESDNLRKFKSNLAAVALCVGVGCFCDPHDLQGLSHFTEHMIFMGSKKYPKENEFDQYCSTHSGYDNAYTECEYTLFHFDIIEKHLAGALDRFSQLFINPLMSLDSMQREIIAVESEFQNNINDDDVRMAQIYAQMISERHVASTFIWGNFQTLRDGIRRDDLHRRLHEFRERNYTADKMFLCVQSSIEISRIERSIVSYFSNIPSWDLVSNIPTTNATATSKDPFTIFKSDFYEKIFFVKSTSEKCKLLLTFLFPPVGRELKYLEYLASLIQYEGPGSLSDYFIDEALALKVKARVGHQNFEGNSFFTLFTIEVNLTTRGFEDFDLVLEAIFAYLLLLKSTKIEEHATRYQEFKEIKEILFRYKKEKSAIQSVEEIAVNMKFYDDKHILVGGDLCADFDASSMQQMINRLNEMRFNMVVLSDKYCKKYERREEWFGTEFSAVDFPQKYKNLWNERWLRNELFLPRKNEFICKNFGIFSSPSELSEKFPRKIFENDVCQCFYKMDKKFKLPYGYIFIHFASQLTQLTVENLNMTSIYSMCVKNFLAEKLYPATLSGYNFKLNSIDNGMMLRLGGFNEKLPLLIDIITKEMNRSIEKNVFETFKKELRKNCHNCLMDLNILNDDCRLSVIKRNHRSFLERYKHIDAIKFHDFKSFVERFLPTLSIKVLIQGNLVESRAQYVNAMILQNLKLQGGAKNCENNEASQVYQLPLGANHVKLNSMRVNDHNSVIKNYYQIGVSSIKSECLAEFLVSLLTEPLFDILRTHEQLGYGISCCCRKNCGMLAITITVEYQENKNSSNVIDEKIEEFLCEFQRTLDSINDADFLAAKRCFLSTKLCNDTDLEMEVNRNFDEMRNSEVIFNRNELEAMEIEKIKREEILEFYRETFIGDSVRKLSIQIVGSSSSNGIVNGVSKTTETLNGITERQNVMINDLKLFQESIKICS